MSTLGDYNGDEFADIFRLSTTATESRLDILSGVDGTTPLTPTVVLDMTGATLVEVASGDVTGDGLDDLVELRRRNADGLLTVVVREAPGMAERNWLSLGANQTVKQLRLSDVNDDGRADVHVQGGATFEVLEGATLARLIFTGFLDGAFGYGDVTGDGRPDAIFSDYTSAAWNPENGGFWTGGWEFWIWTNSLITTGVSTAAQTFADNSSIPDRKQVAFLQEFIATGTNGDATVLLDAVSLTARSTSDVILTNPGFEATGRLQGIGYTVAPGQSAQPVSGWTFQGQGGTNLSTCDPMADNGTDVEGEMVAFLQGDGSRLRQTVSGLTPSARYTLGYLVNARRSVVSPRPTPEPIRRSSLTTSASPPLLRWSPSHWRSPAAQLKEWWT